MECSNCGSAVSAGMKFCKVCGTQVDAPASVAVASLEACPNCGAAYAPGARFCKTCGHAFALITASTPPAQPYETLTMAPSRPVASPVVEPPQHAPLQVTDTASVDEVIAPSESVSPAVSAQVDERAAAATAPAAVGAAATAGTGAAFDIPDHPDPVAAQLPLPRSRRQVNGGPPGWLLGVFAAVIVVLLSGAAFFAYYKFFRPVPHAQAMSAAPASAAPGPAATTTMPVANAPQATTIATASPAQAPAANAAVGEPVANTPTQLPVATAPGQQEATPSPSQTAIPVSSLPPRRPEIATSLPVDHTLRIASDLVRKGERAAARGDYADAIRHARSALDVHPGYSAAERLLRRAQDEQQQARAQSVQTESATPPAPLASPQQTVAAVPSGPTPDELYNQRAHSECARGLFGKACRHQIREQICAGVTPGMQGASLCKQ